jgi:hypothetical protein
MFSFQITLEELCVQKPRSYPRAEDYLVAIQESWTPPGWGMEGL